MREKVIHLGAPNIRFAPNVGMNSMVRDEHYMPRISNYAQMGLIRQSAGAPIRIPAGPGWSSFAFSQNVAAKLVPTLLMAIAAAKTIPATSRLYWMEVAPDSSLIKPVTKPTTFFPQKHR